MSANIVGQMTPIRLKSSSSQYREGIDISEYCLLSTIELGQMRGAFRILNGRPLVMSGHAYLVGVDCRVQWLPAGLVGDDRAHYGYLLK